MTKNSKGNHPQRHLTSPQHLSTRCFDVHIKPLACLGFASQPSLAKIHRSHRHFRRPDDLKRVTA